MWVETLKEKKKKKKEVWILNHKRQACKNKSCYCGIITKTKQTKPKTTEITLGLENPIERCMVCVMCLLFDAQMCGEWPKQEQNTRLCFV